MMKCKRAFVLTALVLCFLLLACSSTEKGSQPLQRLAIERVNIADPSRPEVVPNQTVLIEDGVIVAVAGSGEISVPKGYERVDAAGKYLIPALANMHLHVARMSETYLGLMVANGVTLVRDMGGDLLRIRDTQERIRKGGIPGPQILTPGPILESREWLLIVKPLFVEPLYHRIPIQHPSESEEVFGMLAPLEVDFVKTRNVASPQVYRSILDEAGRYHLQVAGHEPLRVGLKKAIELGQSSVEHLPLLSLTAPGRNPSEEELRELVEVAREKNTYFTPTIVAIQARLYDVAGLQKKIAEEDPRMAYLSADHLKDWEDQIEERVSEGSSLDWPSMIEQSYEHFRLMHQSGIPMLAGTDLGTLFVYPGYSLHDEMEMLVDKLGMTPREALLTATLRPAEFLGLDNVRGSISEGRQADLVLLDANPFETISNTKKIHAVVVAGELLGAARLEEIRQWAAAKKDTQASYPRSLSNATTRFDSEPNLEDALLLGGYQFAKGDYEKALTYYRYVDEQGAETVEHLDRFLLNVKLNLLFEEDSPLQCRDVWNDADAVLKGLESSSELESDILERIVQAAEYRKCEETKNRYERQRAEG